MELVELGNFYGRGEDIDAAVDQFLYGLLPADTLLQLATLVMPHFTYSQSDAEIFSARLPISDELRTRIRNTNITPRARATAWLEAAKAPLPVPVDPSPWLCLCGHRNLGDYCLNPACSNTRTYGELKLSRGTHWRREN